MGKDTWKTMEILIMFDFLSWIVGIRHCLCYLSQSKGNHKQDENTTPWMGENICKQSNWQRINLKNIQAAHGAQYQKKQPNPKKGRRPK